jgi:uncharacterized membrane protein
MLIFVRVLCVYNSYYLDNVIIAFDVPYDKLLGKSSLFFLILVLHSLALAPVTKSIRTCLLAVAIRHYFQQY